MSFPARRTSPASSPSTRHQPTCLQQIQHRKRSQPTSTSQTQPNESICADIRERDQRSRPAYVSCAASSFTPPPPRLVAQRLDRNLLTRYSLRACEYTPARSRIMYQNITVPLFNHPRRAQDVASTSSFTDELNSAPRTVTAGVDRWPMSERTRTSF